MRIQPYELGEVNFAYCYHVYYRWQTHKLRPCRPLADLDQPTLDAMAMQYDIRVLDCNSDPTSLLLLLSLRPAETVSACASKLKGQITKWLRQRLGLHNPAQLLKRGYFAASCGKATRQQVDEYLSKQSTHHGYANRPRPPVFVQTFETPWGLEDRCTATHCCTVLSFHFVFSTWHRQGIFGRPAAQAVLSVWRQLQVEMSFALRKVSFVPDHVHVAIRAHPTVSPGMLAIALMNAAQDVIFREFPSDAIQAKLERLWQPSAYVGSFGDLATPRIQKYIREWSSR